MSKKFKIPKTIGQAVAFLLTKRRGLHPKCNRQNCDGKLCKRPAVRWYIYTCDSGYRVLPSAMSLCEEHAYQPHEKFFDVIVFNSWDEIQVFQVMQS